MRRARTPTILQMEAVECGAAALGMILAAHGRWEPLEDLRAACGVSRDGSTAANIVKAARGFGLEARGVRQEPETIADISLPAILHWEFNHFVVLEDVGRDRVRINDPARGPRTVTREEFDASFTGIALVFSKGEGFVPSGHRFSVREGATRRLRSSTSALALLVGAGLLLLVPGVAVAIIVEVFVNDVLVGGRTGWLPAIVAGLVAAAGVQMGLTWLQGRVLVALETKLALVGISGFLWHVLRLPMRFFMQRHAGDVGQRIALNPTLAQMLTSQGAIAGVNAIVALLYLGVMIAYDVSLAAVAAAIAVANVLVVRRVYEANAVATQRISIEASKLRGAAVAGLLNIETLKATGREGDFFARWAGHHTKSLNAQGEYAPRALALSTVATLLALLGTAAVLLVGGLQVIDQTLTLGAFFGFLTLLGSFVTPVRAAATFSTQLQEAENTMRRLDDVLNHEEAPPAAGDGPAELEGAVELRDVTFGHSPLSPPLIEGFSLRVAAGARIALVGGSGSGKSTIARIIAGLNEPWSGEILFDGRPRSEFSSEAFHDGLALVDQEIVLFAGTIAENLTLWDPTVPQERIVAAARDAGIHAEIACRAGGYYASVVEDGRNFSGGQRQRIELARALVVQPRVLVLDEATSALDPMTELAIDGALRRRGCTCLIIAHRLSTIRDCDEIVVLKEGQVVERGVHDDLMAAEGLYAKLVGDAR